MDPISQLFSFFQSQQDPAGPGPSLGDLLGALMAQRDPYAGAPGRGQLGQMNRDRQFFLRMGDQSGNGAYSPMDQAIATELTRRQYVAPDGRYARHGAVPLDQRG